MTASMGKVRPQWSQEWAKADFRVEFTVCRDCRRAERKEIVLPSIRISTTC